MEPFDELAARRAARSNPDRDATLRRLEAVDRYLDDALAALPSRFRVPHAEDHLEAAQRTADRLRTVDDGELDRLRADTAFALAELEALAGRGIRR